MSRVDVNIRKENYDKVMEVIEKNNGKIEFNSYLKKYYHIIVEIEEKIGWDIIIKYSINSHIQMSKEDIFHQLGVILWVTIVFGIPIVLSLIL